MSTEQEFEVLETMMFQRPPEWGRRVIKKADGEIMLQTTGDKGQTWQDTPIPEAKLMLPESKTRTFLVGNPYEGLSIVPRDEMMTRSVSNGAKELRPEIIEAIDSGNLLAKAIAANNRSDEIETITFLGTYAATGLASGSLWRDENNYVRIVP